MIHIRHVWSVLATNISVDQATQNISLFGVLEQLTLKKSEIEANRKPGEKALNVHFPFRLVTFLRRIGEGAFAGNMKVEVIDPRGEILAVMEQPITFEPAADRLRVIIEAPGMPVTTDGYYFFRTSIKSSGGDYEEINELPLQIVLN
jgi:hypothetical protein